MKRLLSYILLFAALLGSSCAKDTPSVEGEGTVNFRISIAGGTRAYDPMQTLLIRIFNTDGGLIRRYSSLDEMPQNLYLVAGNYRIIVDAGDRSEATWTNKTYHGEKEFTVVANKATTEQVPCTTLNVGAQVTFDATVTTKLDLGAKVIVSASNIFSEEEIGNVPTLEFDASTNDATGYFLLPEGIENLSWSFHGEGTKVGVVEKTGVIEKVESAMLYQLKFQYSKTPDGFVNITVTVDKVADKHYDDIGFSPQPTIKGENCSMSKVVGFSDTDLSFSVTSIKELANVTLTAANTNYTIFDIAGGTSSPEGIACEVLDSRRLRITLSVDFLSQFASGIHALQFALADADGGTGTGKLTLAMPGLLGATDCNFWLNTATIQAIVVDPGATDVKIACRIDGGEWRYLPTTADEAFTYSATLEPKWIQSLNSKNMPVYSLSRNDGFFAGRTYEYKLVIDGADKGEIHSLSTKDEAQAIPHGNMEDGGLSSFGTSNGSAPYWGSGNNTFTPGLCTQSTYNGMQGSKCAKLSASSALGILASGNLFTGCFDRPGGAFSTTGYVYFGLPYAWTARPSALRLKYYAEKLGQVNIDKEYGAPLKSGDQDQARILVAIVDWNSRHIVTSGGSKPTGTWDPAAQSSTAEGRIIAYGSLMIDQASSGGTMIDTVLPLYYYDQNAAKPSGTYSLVISCSTSAYGDYMAGCDSNVLYVDDFRWEY